MKTNQYLADSANIGDWSGNEDQAVDLWNAHIAPVLIAAHEAIVEASNYYDQRDLDRVGYLGEWAWDEFCGRAAGDDETIAAALAVELRDRLS